MHTHYTIKPFCIIIIVHPNSPALTSTEVLQYSSDDATVMLTWTPEHAYGVFYNVSIIPLASILYYTGDTSVQLTVAYNTLYNVSVVATRCGQNSTVVELKLGNNHTIKILSLTGFKIN